MTRFFIPIDSAIDVILAALDAPDGTITIPSPQALNIGALADYLTDCWRLSPYQTMGMRPGEKSHEAMLSMSELDRIVFDADSGFYQLHGPMATLTEHDTMVGSRSEDAELMEPDEFVGHAEDSESV